MLPLDEQSALLGVWMNNSQWGLDEQEPVDEQSQVEAGGGRRWMNNSPWRLEGVDGGDKHDPCFDRSAPTQVCFLRFAVRNTPPDEQDPVLAVASRTQGCFLRSAVRRYVSNVSIIYEVFMLYNHFIATLYHYLGLTY